MLRKYFFFVVVVENAFQNINVRYGDYFSKAFDQIFHYFLDDEMEKFRGWFYSCQLFQAFLGPLARQTRDGG